VRRDYEVALVLERYGDFCQFLNQTADDSSVFKPLRQSETTGHPLGSEEWIEKIEKSTGRTLKAQKRGPKKKNKPIN
jgi:putative transposase